MVEFEIDGVRVMVRQEDFGRLQRFVADASAALRDQPELLTRIDSVERTSVAVRKMADSVVGSVATMVTSLQGKEAASALLARIAQSGGG